MIVVVSLLEYPTVTRDNRNENAMCDIYLLSRLRPRIESIVLTFYTHGRNIKCGLRNEQIGCAPSHKKATLLLLAGEGFHSGKNSLAASTDTPWGKNHESELVNPMKG